MTVEPGRPPPTKAGATGRLRSLPILLVLILGLSFSVGFFFAVENAEQERAREEFDRYARELTNTLRTNLADNVELARATKSLFRASEFVTRLEFQAFTASLLADHPDLLALEWIPAVPAAARADFEQAARADGLTDFQFRDLQPGGTLAPAAAHATYYPVYYVEPQAGNTRVLGFNLASDPTRLTSLERAQITGQATLSRRITLLQDAEPRTGLALFVPVYTYTETIVLDGDIGYIETHATLVGFTVAAFSLDTLVENDLHLLSAREVELWLFDANTSAPQDFLYYYPNTATSAPPPPTTGLFWKTTIPVADRHWNITVRPTAAFPSTHPFGQGLPALFAGLALTALTMFYLRSFLHRADYIERAVTERTAELAATNHALSREIALRRGTERTLQESQRFIQHVADSVQSHIYVYDLPSTQIVYSNRAVNSVFGYPSDPSAEPPPASTTTLTHPDDNERLHARLQRFHTLHTGEMLETEYRVRDADGTWRWIYSRETPFTFDAAQATVQILGIAIDVTHSKQAEADLRQYTRLLELLNDITEIAITPNQFNDALHGLAERLRALYQTDVVHLTLWDAEHERTIPVAATGPNALRYPTIVFPTGEPTLTAAVIKAGHPLVIANTMNTDLLSRQIAQNFSAHSVLALPLIAEGRPLGAALIAFDPGHTITPTEIASGEQAANQIALTIAKAQAYSTTLAERARLQALIAASRDGLLMIGRDRQVLVVNTPALTYLDLPESPATWTARPLYTALLHLRHTAPAFAKVLLREMRSLKHADPAPTQGEGTVGPRTLQWMNLPVFSDSGLLGRLLVLRDITELRQIEQMRTDLTRTMVHDLRNPLSSIFSALELLTLTAQEQLDPEQFQIIEIAFASASKMLALVNAILDVSRLESGHMPINRTTVALPALVTEQLRLQSTLLNQKSLQVENAVPPTTPPLSADPALLERILQNLIGNALKFTPPHGTLRISAAPLPDNPDWLRIAVSDTGGGIPANLAGRLFQKFSTGHQQASGSGLGLAFCKLAVEAHGGHIGVENHPGVGATFWFTLPVSKELS